MSIEPTNAFTVCIRAAKRSDEGKTPEETIADIRARFPHAFDEAGCAIPSRFAKMENAARLKQHPVSTMARPQAPAILNKGTLASLPIIAAKGEATRQSILDVLTKPMTCPDVAYALGRTRQLINRHLVILAGQGDVVGRKVKGIVVWERRQGAAE